MKLPPQALTAPSLCPRCDTPAPGADVCRSCSLPLRTCAACHGMVAPFDRYCGFCGRDLALGTTGEGQSRTGVVVAVTAVLIVLAVLAGLVAVRLVR